MRPRCRYATIFLCRQRRRGAKRRLQHNAAQRSAKPSPVTCHPSPAISSNYKKSRTRPFPISHFPFPHFLALRERSRVVARDDNERKASRSQCCTKKAGCHASLLFNISDESACALIYIFGKGKFPEDLGHLRFDLFIFGAEAIHFGRKFRIGGIRGEVLAALA